MNNLTSLLSIRRACMASCTLVVLVALCLAVYAQSGCPPPSSDVKGWPKGTTIYYDLSAIPPDMRGQIESAFQKWNAANGGNGSGVTFAPVDASHPNATFVVQIGSACVGTSCTSGRTDVTHDAAGIVSRAVTTLDINNQSGTFFNTQLSSFSTALLKVICTR